MAAAVYRRVQSRPSKKIIPVQSTNQAIIACSWFSWRLVQIGGDGIRQESFFTAGQPPPEETAAAMSHVEDHAPLARLQQGGITFPFPPVHREVPNRRACKCRRGGVCGNQFAQGPLRAVFAKSTITGTLACWPASRAFHRRPFRAGVCAVLIPRSDPCAQGLSAVGWGSMSARSC